MQSCFFDIIVNKNRNLLLFTGNRDKLLQLSTKKGDVFELPYGASFDEIKKSYRKLLKKYHPDKFHNDEKKYKIAQDLVDKLNMAYNYFEEKYKK